SVSNFPNLQIEILFTVAEGSCRSKGSSCLVKGPLMAHPSNVLIAYGPFPQLFITSQGSNIQAALAPISRSTFAFMLGICTLDRWGHLTNSSEFTMSSTVTGMSFWVRTSGRM